MKQEAIDLTEKERYIREIQQNLRNIEKSISGAPSLIPDGIYSDETKKAVEAFQRRQGLDATGVVNYETWDKLIRESRIVDKRRELPVQVAPVKNEDLPLRQGETDELIITVKTMLGRVADKYANFNRLAVNDFFDGATADEVRRWQRVAFIEESGEVDKETWDSLAEHYLIK